MREVLSFKEYTISACSLFRVHFYQMVIMVMMVIMVVIVIRVFVVIKV
jgi:hypothetical protein